MVARDAVGTQRLGVEALTVFASMLLLAGCDVGVDVDGGVGGSSGEGAHATNESSSTGPLASKCGETPDAPAFEIGTGEVCFEPLNDGDLLPVMAGPQGGFHVWVALLCAACPDELHSLVGVKLEGSDDWVGETGERIIELRSDQFAGLYALLAGTTADPTSVLPEGTNVRVVVRLSSLEGEVLFEGEKHVTLGPTEIWHNVCDPDESTCGKPDAQKCCS